MMISRAWRWLAVSVIIILVAGSALTLWTAGEADRDVRDQLLIKTRLAAAGINASQVAALTSSAADLNSTEYLALKQQMTALRLSDPDIRFTYLIGRKPNGSFFFFVDSEPPDSPDYSPPGQSYPEVTSLIVSVYSTGRDLTEGPDSDRWGTWISGVVPVNEPAYGGRIAVFGMDVDARNWDRQVILACLPPITGSLLALVLVLAFFFIQQRNDRERRRLEASELSLRESEGKFRTLFETAGDAIFILKGAVIVDCNLSTEKIFGCTRDQIIGHTPADFSPQRQPDGRLSTERAHDYISAALSGEPLSFEWVHIRCDGTPFRAEVSGNRILLLGEYYLQTFVRDITERKKAEEALRESEESIRIIIEQSPSSIQVLSPDGRVVQVNRAFEELWGLTLEDLKDYNIIRDEQLIHLGILSHIKRGFSGEAVTIPLVQYDTSPIAGAGQKRWVLGTIYPVRDAAGFIRNVIVTHEDITERKMAEDALKQTTRKLSLLNSIAFNDIQNAIFVLSGYFELEKMIPMDEKLQQYLDKQTRIVQTITESLKFANNYQSLGLKPPRWQNVMHCFLLGISHLDISTISRHIDIEGLEIFADPLLENVFFTFAENVLLHGKTATMIVLRYDESLEGLTLFFEDNGVGIQNEMKEKIFERRYEEKKGMGLFLVREILSITGITITETGEPGKGAVFEMTVPKGAYRFFSTDEPVHEKKDRGNDAD